MTELEGLNPKQIAFAQAYVRNKNDGPKAAISAGYSEKTASQIASRLLNNVKIKAYLDRIITEATQKTIDETCIDQKWIVNRLLEIQERALEEDPSSGKFAQYQPAIKAIEVIAKTLGLSEPKKIDMNANGFSVIINAPAMPNQAIPVVNAPS